MSWDCSIYTFANQEKKVENSSTVRYSIDSPSKLRYLFFPPPVINGIPLQSPYSAASQIIITTSLTASTSSHLAPFLKAPGRWFRRRPLTWLFCQSKTSSTIIWFSSRVATHILRDHTRNSYEATFSRIENSRVAEKVAIYELSQCSYQYSISVWGRIDIDIEYGT